MMSTHFFWNRHFLNSLNRIHVHKRKTFLGAGKTFSLPLNCISKVDSLSFSAKFSAKKVGQCFGDSRQSSVLQRLFDQPQSKHLPASRSSGPEHAMILDNLNFYSTSSPSSCIASCRRWFTTSSSQLERLKPEDVRKRVDNLTDCFVEARELLGDARESLGSTYFSEDMMEAQEAVSTTVAKYKALLAELEEDQRNGVIRTVGLRMEELKAQEQAIKDLLE